MVITTKHSVQSQAGTDDRAIVNSVEEALTFYMAAESARQAAYLVRLQLEMTEFLTRDSARAEREAQDDPTATVYQIDVLVRERSSLEKPA